MARETTAPPYRDALDELTLDEGSPLAPLRGALPVLPRPGELELVCPTGTTDPAPCDRCCTWALPIYVERARRNQGRPLIHDVALAFHEWLVWHLHTRLHQAAPPAVLC